MEDLTPSNYSFSTSHPEEGPIDEVANPLPRAVLRMNNHVLLDGQWRFALDDDDVGLREDWASGHTYRETAQWPGSVEEHLAMARGHQGAAAWKDQIVVWYEREFNLPEVAEPQTRSMLQLTFGACGYETRVWLNGQPLKTIEGEEIHYGEYTSFTYELNENNLHLVNRLTVRIADNMDAETPRGKQESYVYKRGGIWYQTYTGAVRSVWLEVVERNRLRSRVGVVSVVEDHLVRFNLTLRIHDPGDYTIRLQVFDPVTPNRKDPLAASDFPLHLEAGQWQQRVVLEVPSAELWSPEAPHRYRLVAQLIDSEGYPAQIETLFGLRKIEARGRYVYLNNQPIYLDGILYQPGQATYEEMQRHMHAMKALGCNLVRVHIAGIDPRIYNLADELGLLLWVEVPSPHSSTPRSRENHRAELLRLVTLSETHPSIIIWSLYNEDWGAQDIATNAETRKYIIDTYHFMQIAYPQFLVVDNDGWHHISYTGRLKSDLLTAHLYTPDLTRWRELLDRLVGGEMEGTAAFPLVVGDPFFYRHQVPLVVSEWGGFGFSDYGGPEDAEARTNSIRAFKQELRRRPIAGDVYTQATNIEDERNGLIDPHTGALSVPEGLLASRQMEYLQ
ncbi:glycoside hydrolase family 2 TIM barrel-domain containing protein [Hymenobacter sp. BT770]|uniref:glycoside hydrolase family 2 protein n=1 Tax=Hymenobacter sp. BT770 TaxID=2886942 RepID=UPI001D11F536|nr:sugar-binding domain-containing protein [Hymenobacter sp. BT770]MCC3153078.1 glycoside hydrolase family 2 [Hymenobacter sp. BT770]MDO3415009.1 glycoside hydrolase family 2 TIM barrel-domain containing protein [Hymenobacter sp. BT770]